MMQETLMLHVCGKDEGVCVRNPRQSHMVRLSIAGQTGKKVLKDTPLYKFIQGVCSCFKP